MKITQPMLLSLVVAFAGVSTATDTNLVSTNTTTEGSREIASMAGIRAERCLPIEGALWTWYYNVIGDGPYECEKKNDKRVWSMLNAYRSGGTLNVHWKYTNDLNDKECLKNWNYYSDNGQQLVAKVSGRTTTLNDSKRWCPLPVYRQGGVQGKQWEYCFCEDS